MSESKPLPLQGSGTFAFTYFPMLEGDVEVSPLRANVGRLLNMRDGAGTFGGRRRGPPPPIEARPRPKSVGRFRLAALAEA